MKTGLVELGVSFNILTFDELCASEAANVNLVVSPNVILNWSALPLLIPVFVSPINLNLSPLTSPNEPVEDAEPLICVQEFH